MRTADGTPIENGLRVFTNNLDTATVTINDRYKPWKEHNWNSDTDEWWFYVTLDKGGIQIMSESRVATMFEGKKA
jgi:hypothetical protein